MQADFVVVFLHLGCLEVESGATHDPAVTVGPGYGDPNFAETWPGPGPDPVLLESCAELSPARVGREGRGAEGRPDLMDRVDEPIFDGAGSSWHAESLATSPCSDTAPRDSSRCLGPGALRSHGSRGLRLRRPPCTPR